MVVIFVKELIHVIISPASQRLPLYGPNTCNLWEGVYLPTLLTGQAVWIKNISFNSDGNSSAIQEPLCSHIQTDLAYLAGFSYFGINN